MEKGEEEEEEEEEKPVRNGLFFNPVNGASSGEANQFFSRKHV